MAEPPQRTKCKRLAEELERMGFAQRTYLIGEGTEWEKCVLDYGDPRTEEAIRREYPMMERVEDYAEFSSRGSLSFEPPTYVPNVKGEVPMSIGRPIDARGFERSEIYPPDKCSFDEVHLHVWDHQAAVHFHLSCEDPEISELRRFIENSREVARKFIKY